MLGNVRRIVNDIGKLHRLRFRPRLGEVLPIDGLAAGSVPILRTRNIREIFHEFRHFGAKGSGHLVQRYIRVLHHIVKVGGCDGSFILGHAGNDGSHCNQVDFIGFTRVLAPMIFLSMCRLRKFPGSCHKIQNVKILSSAHIMAGGGT
jgi:hypothetical protein